MPDIRFSSSLSPFLILLVVLSAVLAASLAYRRTVPPIGSRLKRLLIALRASGLAAAFLLLAEPLISLVHHSTEPPTTVILIDNSASLTLADQQGDRALALRKIVNSPELRRLSGMGITRFVSFDAVPRELRALSPDSFQLNGERTNISEALKFAGHLGGSANVQGVLLVSDGNATGGEDPVGEAESMGIPVFTVGVGDTNAPRDLSVRNIFTNEIAYAGSVVPVNAVIRSTGFGGERVEVTLSSEGIVADHTTVTLEAGIREYPVSFSFKPEGEGIRQLLVEVSTLPGEITARNNRRNASVKVLKNKLRIAIIAGAPSPDFATVRRVLEADKNLRVSTFTERKEGTFYEASLSDAVLRDNDCVVLVGFPTSRSAPQSILTLLERFQQGLPFLFILSRTTDTEKLRALESALPVVVQEGSSTEFEAFLSPSESQRANVLLKIHGAPSPVWNTLPPLLTTQSLFRAKRESEVIAVKRLGSTPLTDPMLVWRTINSAKSIALLGYGLQRWTMLGGDEDLAAEQFVSNAVRWLTTAEDNRRIRVQPTKDAFLTSERAAFFGQVYDENLQPVDDATITVTAKAIGTDASVTLDPLGNGQYEGGFDLLDVGNYSYTAEVTADGRSLGIERGSFSVGGVNVEFQETQMNVRVLRQIADKSNGQYWPAQNLDGLADAIRQSPRFRAREVVRTDEFSLWNSAWILAAMICVFALEWLLRKRAGML